MLGTQLRVLLFERIQPGCELGRLVLGLRRAVGGPAKTTHSVGSQNPQNKTVETVVMHWTTLRAFVQPFGRFLASNLPARLGRLLARLVVAVLADSQQTKGIGLQHGKRAKDR